ncbi:MAG: SAM-dependent methyltransferase [Clostridia bacterium]|nr:SAM-dependent methyltransferase [Clostridia bacterium]
MLDKRELKNQLENIIDKKLIESVSISNPLKKGENIPAKVKISSVIIKNQLAYQVSEYIGQKVIHKNIEPETVVDEIINIMEKGFKQCNITSNMLCTVLMNKKKQFTLTGVKENINAISLPKEHNKAKNYIIGEGEYVDWMYKLGLMDKNGVVLKHRQKKFRQINKFLEMLKDIEGEIPENSVIIDMGCGKSYLTFAMYHYFNIINKKNIEIRGYDLKRDVVEYCNELAEKFGFNNLKFYCEDISNIENTDDRIAMIITLHACDTATDYAIYHGIRWGCRVMMNVPCCQHELFHQMKNNDMSIMLNHGIIKERFAALLTDSIRARIIELKGYRVQVMEFIDMEHTPKNIMIRSVKTGKPVDKKKKEDLERIIKEYNIEPTLYKLFWGD